MEAQTVDNEVGHKPDLIRTIQIHPTRRCNLECLHCYSDSSPIFREMLNIESLKSFLVFAYEKGFNNIALSGGEPFLYENIDELLKWAKQVGYNITMVTNGMLLGSLRNQKLLDYIDLLAVSVDGREELHDKIRAKRGAFRKMLEGIEVLKKHDKTFGFIHTITEMSWQDLIWLGDFAYNHGAKLLQLHPLENTGRAISTMQTDESNDNLSYQSFILANYLKSKYANDMVIQLDLLHREYIEKYPSSVNVFKRSCYSQNDIISLFDSIIIDETGKVLPYSFGFDNDYVIGNVNEFSENIFDDYLIKNSKKLMHLFDSTMNKILNNKEVDIVSWNELFVRESVHNKTFSE